MEGQGGAAGTSWNTCSECKGSGTVSFGQGGFAVNRPCPACAGRGKKPDKVCGACHGSGKVRQDRKIQVKVPAGVEPGTKVRLTGQGRTGRAGGCPGGSHHHVQAQGPPVLPQGGNDILTTVPINLAQATLGSKIKVGTISGNKVVLRIPPGTQSGTRFRIKGQGITKGGRTGDQFVEVKVQIPEVLSDEQQERMREFAEGAGLKW